MNSPQLARKADQQQIVLSKSVQDAPGVVGGRNIITNVYLGGMGPGMTEYLHATVNPGDDTTSEVVHGDGVDNVKKM